MPEQDPNAFTTGNDEAASHVAVKEGLLDTLNRDELQGVIAHEMAHIKNHDAKLMTLLAALIGMIALMSDAAWRSLRVGRGGGGRAKTGGRGGKKGGLGAIILVVWLLSLLVAPLLSRILALGVSRKRELLADASGAQFTRNPAALAGALRKIEDAKSATKAIGRGSAHLCIADPLGRRLTHKQGFIADLRDPSPHGSACGPSQSDGISVRADGGVAGVGLGGSGERGAAKGKSTGRTRTNSANSSCSRMTRPNRRSCAPTPCRVMSVAAHRMASRRSRMSRAAASRDACSPVGMTYHIRNRMPSATHEHHPINASDGRTFRAKKDGRQPPKGSSAV